MEPARSSTTRISLISRIQASDAAAWTELVYLYSPLVAFWCRRLGLSGADVNDATQEIFFEVSRAIDQYRPTGRNGGFRAWLWGVARHRIIDFVRRQERAPIGLGGSTALKRWHTIPESLDESDVVEQTEFQRLLHRALEQVRSQFEVKTWTAFWRTTVDGQSVALVATELELPPGTIRQYRARVLRRLRQQLGEVS